MEEKLWHFFHKNSIILTDLLYILRSGRKTAFHLIDGRVVENYMHLKDLLTILPEEEFLHINKSIIVSKHHISSIQHGVYTMVDGRQLQGRVRTPGTHNNTMHQLEQLHASTAPSFLPSDILHSFSVLDKLPTPFCVVEVVISESSPGMNLVFRYCNDEMAVFEQLPKEKIRDRSFFEIYPSSSNAKWIAMHTDTALNGSSHVVHDYDAKRDIHFTVYCFQPQPGFSACALVDHSAHTHI